MAVTPTSSTRRGSETPNPVEFALLVVDRFQGQGLGTELLSRLIEIGRNEKIESISGSILEENLGMQRICEKLGFTVTDTAQDGMVKASIQL